MRLTDWDKDLTILGQGRDCCKMHQSPANRGCNRVPKRLRTCPRQSNGIVRIVNNRHHQLSNTNAANGGNHGYGRHDFCRCAEHPFRFTFTRGQVVRHRRRLVASLISLPFPAVVDRSSCPHLLRNGPAIILPTMVRG